MYICKMYILVFLLSLILLIYEYINRVVMYNVCIYAPKMFKYAEKKRNISYELFQKYFVMTYN